MSKNIIPPPHSHTKNSEVYVITIRGNLDKGASEELSMLIERLFAQKKFTIVLNLDRVPYISGMAWSCFVSKSQQLRELGGDLLLVYLHPNVRGVMRLLELDSCLSCHDDLAGAIHGLTPGKTQSPSLDIACI